MEFSYNLKFSIPISETWDEARDRAVQNTVVRVRGPRNAKADACLCRFLGLLVFLGLFGVRFMSSSPSAKLT